jgi:hypothetical protein
MGSPTTPTSLEIGRIQPGLSPASPTPVLGVLQSAEGMNLARLGITQIALPNAGRKLSHPHDTAFPKMQDSSNASSTKAGAVK